MYDAVRELRLAGDKLRGSDPLRASFFRCRQLRRTGKRHFNGLNAASIRQLDICAECVMLNSDGVPMRLQLARFINIERQSLLLLNCRVHQLYF